MPCGPGASPASAHGARWYPVMFSGSLPPPAPARPRLKPPAAGSAFRRCLRQTNRCWRSYRRLCPPVETELNPLESVQTERAATHSRFAVWERFKRSNGLTIVRFVVFRYSVVSVRIRNSYTLTLSAPAPAPWRRTATAARSKGRPQLATFYPSDLACLVYPDPGDDDTC